MAGRQQDNDPLLATLLSLRRGDPRRETAIQHLLTAQAEPAVRRLLRCAVERGGIGESEAEDLASEVSLRLLRKLRRLADDPRTEPIVNFADYVGAVAHNAVDDLQRGRDPLRARLAQRVRYLMTHTTAFAQWGHAPLCGLAAWVGRHQSVAVAAPASVPATAVTDARELRRIVEGVLVRSGGPVELKELVEALAVAADLPAEPFVSPRALRRLAVESDPLGPLAARQYLARLWSEIATLPPRQRTALLLQLRLEDGESVARLLPPLGIADVRTLASTLAMPLAELLALWNRLPLEDARIASMLGVTRQQVINLRKSARERLARRMRHHEKP
jgi:RNA polymerase sigma factor (sigma-70 family)